MKISGCGNSKSNINGKWHKIARKLLGQSEEAPHPSEISIEDKIRFELSKQGVFPAPETINEVYQEIVDLGQHVPFDDPNDVFDYSRSTSNNEIRWAVQRWLEKNPHALGEMSNIFV